MRASTSQSSPALGADILVNRRRPGRTSADAALVPLLRNPASTDLIPDSASRDNADTVETSADHDDPRRLIRGIGFGLLFSAPFWLALAVLGRAVFR